MTGPRFSVVLPTCDRLQKLPRAIHSVEQQTERDFELLVVDDGSTDGTGDFLERALLEQSFPGVPALRLIRNRTAVGAGEARNQAIEQSRGEFIAFLDDDDVWMPDHLAKQAERLAANPRAGACTAAHIEFDASGAEYEPDLVPLIEHDEPLIYLIMESYVHTMSVLTARREVFDEIGLLDTTLQVCHDWDWCIRLVLSGRDLLPPAGSATVRREIPGGLVTRLEDWYGEEMRILDQTFSQNSGFLKYRRAVLAYRKLLFAKLAFSRGKHGFAIRRLAGAFGQSPTDTLRVAHLRLARQRRTGNRLHE